MNMQIWKCTEMKLFDATKLSSADVIARQANGFPFSLFRQMQSITTIKSKRNPGMIRMKNMFFSFITDPSPVLHKISCFQLP